jgi:hypothetical protein
MLLWSPDGAAIVYLGGGSSSPRVCPFVVSVATGHARTLRSRVQD